MLYENVNRARKKFLSLMMVSRNNKENPADFSLEREFNEDADKSAFESE